MNLEKKVNICSAFKCQRNIFSSQVCYVSILFVLICLILTSFFISKYVWLLFSLELLMGNSYSGVSQVIFGRKQRSESNKSRKPVGKHQNYKKKQESVLISTRTEICDAQLQTALTRAGTVTVSFSKTNTNPFKRLLNFEAIGIQ